MHYMKACIKYAINVCIFYEGFRLKTKPIFYKMDMYLDALLSIFTQFA